MRGDVKRKVDLVGVPFNSAGTTDGVARAPDALRRSALVERLEAAGLSVSDRGDLDLPAPITERDPESHIIAIAALTSMVRHVRDAIADVLADGSFPLVLGGDCPVLLGCLAAVAERQPPRLLFIDGHEDAWPAERSTTGEAADMELGWLLRRGVDRLPTELRVQVPVLAPVDVVVLGARDERELAESEVASIGGSVRVVRPSQVADSTSEVAGWAATTLSSRGPWWLHVDLDVLATESLAAVDYRQPGGLDWPTLSHLTKRALASPDVIGWTVTIYNPDLDPGLQAGERIARYIAESIGALAASGS